MLRRGVLLSRNVTHYSRWIKQTEWWGLIPETTCRMRFIWRQKCLFSTAWSICQPRRSLLFSAATRTANTARAAPADRMCLRTLNRKIREASGIKDSWKRCWKFPSRDGWRTTCFSSRAMPITWRCWGKRGCAGRWGRPKDTLSKQWVGDQHLDVCRVVMRCGITRSSKGFVYSPWSLCRFN